jgi:hypothetical protein
VDLDDAFETLNAWWDLAGEDLDDDEDDDEDDD